MEAILKFWPILIILASAVATLAVIKGKVGWMGHRIRELPEEFEKSKQGCRAEMFKEINDVGEEVDKLEKKLDDNYINRAEHKQIDRGNTAEIKTHISDTIMDFSKVMTDEMRKMVTQINGRK